MWPIWSWICWSGWRRPIVLLDAVPGGPLASEVCGASHQVGVMLPYSPLHHLLLEPGDGLLLPNHGYKATAMHSVFCASDEPTYALSMAVRETDPPPLPVPASPIPLVPVAANAPP